MIPKTKFQKLAFSLSSKLPSLTENQKQFAINNIYPPVIYARKSGAMSCQSCGHKWNDKKAVTSSRTVCPHCGKRLNIEVTRKHHFSEMYYYGVITTIQGCQVYRMFSMFINFHFNGKAVYRFYEVYQHWLSADCRSSVLISRSRTPSVWYYDAWNYRSPMEVRKDSPHFRYYISPSATFLINISKSLKKRGITKNFYGNHPFRLMKEVASDNRLETLLKVNQIQALNYVVRYGNIDKYWPSIKICLRHKYNITDLWFDYISNLIRFGKDIRNPKYVCPDNLQEVHDELVEHIHRIEERERRERQARYLIEEEQRRLKQLEESKKEEENYQKEKGKFFDINFTDGVVTVRVLNSIQEFFEEGKEMHHCVFANRYYNHKDSLILTARVNEERMETVEVSLNNLEILQSRGKYNQDSPYHSRIISLVKNNLDAIAKLRSAS